MVNIKSLLLAAIIFIKENFLYSSPNFSPPISHTFLHSSKKMKNQQWNAIKMKIPWNCTNAENSFSTWLFMALAILSLTLMLQCATIYTRGNNNSFVYAIITCQQKKTAAHIAAWEKKKWEKFCLQKLIVVKIWSRR